MVVQVCVCTVMQFHLSDKKFVSLWLLPLTFLLTHFSRLLLISSDSSSSISQMPCSHITKTCSSGRNGELLFILQTDPIPMWWTTDHDTATTRSFYTPHGLLENPLHINEMSLPSHTSHPVTDRVVFYPCNIWCIPSTTLIHPTLEYWRDTLHPSLAVSLKTSIYYCMAATTITAGY